MQFICEIESTTNEIEELKGVTYTKRLESNSPSQLLEALAFTNGTGNGVPTLEKLLIHLFDKKTAYAGRNYTIFVKYPQ